MPGDVGQAGWLLGEPAGVKSRYSIIRRLALGGFPWDQIASL